MLWSKRDNLTTKRKCKREIKTWMIGWGLLYYSEWFVDCSIVMWGYS